MIIRKVPSDEVAALSRILPACVAAAEAFGDIPGAELLPGEEAAVAGAVAARRREYASVRHCARRALADLGQPVVPIPSGPAREPVWPAGVVGSMTHCSGYRAAAVARAANVLSLGIDAESDAPLPAGVLGAVARPGELSHLQRVAAADPRVHWDRLLFSAKEAVYKAWFPLAHAWLGFEQASIAFDVENRQFTATLLRQPGLRVGTRTLTQFPGRWVSHAGLLVTAVVVDPQNQGRGEDGDSSGDGAEFRWSGPA